MRCVSNPVDQKLDTDFSPEVFTQNTLCNLSPTRSSTFSRVHHVLVHTYMYVTPTCCHLHYAKTQFIHPFPHSKVAFQGRTGSNGAGGIRKFITGETSVGPVFGETEELRILLHSVRFGQKHQ